MYCLYSINLNPLVTRGLTRGLIHYSGLQGAHGGTSGVVGLGKTETKDQNKDEDKKKDADKNKDEDKY